MSFFIQVKSGKKKNYGFSVKYLTCRICFAPVIEFVKEELLYDLLCPSVCLKTSKERGLDKSVIIALKL